MLFEFYDVKFKDIVDIKGLGIKEGLTAIVGSSGSGKTTILRMLNKMISPTEGRIMYKGKNLKDIPSVKHRREVMMLSQSPVIYEGSIKDNLEIAFGFQERKKPQAEEMVRILEKVHLRKELSAPANTLSGGEKQRLALGRLMLLDPDVYLLDEPSAALDSDTEDIIIQMVSDFARDKGKSVIMVTHSKAIANKYGEFLIEVDGGGVSERGAHERNN